MKVLVNRVIGSIIFLILQLETYSDEYIELNEKSQDGIRDKDSLVKAAIKTAKSFVMIF